MQDDDQVNLDSPLIHTIIARILQGFLPAVHLHCETGRSVRRVEGLNLLILTVPRRLAPPRPVRGLKRLK